MGEDRTSGKGEGIAEKLHFCEKREKGKEGGTGVGGGGQEGGIAPHPFLLAAKQSRFSDLGTTLAGLCALANYFERVHPIILCVPFFVFSDGF